MTVCLAQLRHASDFRLAQLHVVRKWKSQINILNYRYKMFHVKHLRSKLSAGRNTILVVASRDKTATKSAHVGGSSNGRTTDSDSVNLGSSPSPPASF